MESHRHLALCLIDDEAPNGRAFVRRVSAVTSQIEILAAALGCGAGARGRGALFHAGQVLREGGLFVLLESEVPVATISGACRVPHGPSLLVSRAEASECLVHELNGIPARKAYEELAGAGARATGEVAAATAPLVEVSPSEAGRAVVVAELVGDSLRLSQPIENGAVLRCMDGGDSCGEAQRALQAAEAKLGGEIGALLAFCEPPVAGGSEDNGRIGSLLSRKKAVGLHCGLLPSGTAAVDHALRAVAFGDVDGGPEAPTRCAPREATAPAKVKSDAVPMTRAMSRAHHRRSAGRRAPEVAQTAPVAG